MDKRFGPRPAEVREKMRQARWAGDARQSHSAIWADPEFRAREHARRTAAAWARLPARFYALVEKTDGCWIWKGSIDKRGYGRVSLPGGLAEKAHRAAWLIEHGSLPPTGMLLRHHCDNPSCVRPSHLALGDDRLNAHDRVKRNRTTQAKLTVDQVQEIRGLQHLPSREVAARFGIARDTARNIMAGRCWKSIPWPDGQKRAGEARE